MLEEMNLFVTGGAGTLGRAIAQRRKNEGWVGKLTVYSRDSHKHDIMRRSFPDVNYIQGDIRNPETLYNAMVGHDVVIHAGACKIIPVSEYYSIDTFDNNVTGSWNVCAQALRANIKHILGISTDKACHAANAYGASKYLMEKIFQEYARIDSETEFHLVRYGNVLESTGSVIEAWKIAVAEGRPINITDPRMTRFWLSPKQAVDLVIGSMGLASGIILIPKIPGLSIQKLADYVLPEDYKVNLVPLRPGEKIHETLLATEEGCYAVEDGNYFLLRPSTSWRNGTESNTYQNLPAYSSDIAPELTREQLESLLND
jgi:UDP-N-acetylglucosamine 4,6-dehydratase